MVAVVAVVAPIAARLAAGLGDFALTFATLALVFPTRVGMAQLSLAFTHLAADFIVMAAPRLGRSRRRKQRDGNRGTED